MKYRVTVEEQIWEQRVYEVEAAAPEDAAKAAAKLWIVGGVESEEKTINVEERTYVVSEIEGMEDLPPHMEGHRVSGVFGTEVEEAEDAALPDGV